MVNAAVFAKLVEVAKGRQTIAYGELATVADLTIEAREEMKAVGLILDDIADREIAAGRPFLPVVVVSGATGMPGAGLFKYAKRKQIQKGDDLAFWATELSRAYDYWAVNDPPP